MSSFSSSPYGNPPNQLLSSLRHHAAGGTSIDGLDQQQAAQNVNDRSSYASNTGSVTLPSSSRFGFRMRVKQFFKREHKDQDTVTPSPADATPSSVDPTWNVNSATPAVHVSPVGLDALSHVQSSGIPSAAAPPVQVTAFPLLARVQNIPQVEYKLQALKMLRLNDYKQAVYIPPMTKPSLQAPDDRLFPLMKNVEEFLAGEGQVMLILGDSGAGKSTFNRHLENQLWQDYKPGDRIPLLINLPSLERPERKLVVEQLRFHGFSEEQTLELKEHRHFILICDGYDESQLTTNLHTTNYLNQDGQWSAKLIITCRTQYLRPNYRSNFMPLAGSHYDRPTLELYQEAVIAPFSKVQIEDYIERYVPSEPRTWDKKDYMDKLTTIPNLLDLVKNPFLLTLCLEALPSVVKEKSDLLRLRVTRVQLYDNFVEHWLGVNKRRLERQKLSGDALAAYNDLNEEGFEMNGLKFQQDLAAAIFTQQEGRPVVDYIHRRDKGSWKAKFFRPEPEETLLRDASLLSRAGAQYRFVHRSVLEYFYSCMICPSVNKQDEFDPQVHFDSTFTKVSISDHPLSRILVAEPSIVHFLSERVPMNLNFKQHLHDIIELSKTNDQASQAAANAITILVKAGVLFNGADLRGIRIPGANLTDGQFDSVQLQCSDLTKVNFANSWIRKVDFSNARMEGVRFEELPYLDLDREVWSGAYSPDGKIFGVGFDEGDIGIYDTTSWNRIHTLQGHSDTVTALAFLGTGRQLLTSSWDKICSWDCETWQPRVIVTGYATSFFRYAYLVAFSPCGRFIATVGDEEESPDKFEPILSFRLWDSRTSTAISELIGLDKRICNLAFSPSGQVIAITYMDGITRLGYTRTGLPGLALESENGSICCCAYSPGGQRIVSGHREGKITLWESATGKQGLNWEGHTGAVSAVSFSPNGQWIASSGKDDLIKLWDARSGSIVSVFLGNTTTVRSLVFAPDGTQLASISRLDTPIRLWEIDPTEEGPYRTHGSYMTYGSPISSMTYSPDGRSLISGSIDGTIRQYNTASGDPIQAPSSGPFQAKLVVISPDGRVASARETGSVTIWDAGTGLVDFVLCGHTETVEGVSFSPCGHWIATGSNDNSIRLWDSRTGLLCRTLSGHTSWVSSLGFSPDGLALVSGSMDRTLRIWDTSTGESRVLVSVERGVFLSAAYSSDGMQIASHHFPSDPSGWNGSFRGGGLVVLDQQTGEQHHILENKFVSCCALSSCGRWIVAGCSGGVSIWNFASNDGIQEWTFITSINAFLTLVGSVSWRPHCLEFATGCDNGSTQVWSLLSEAGEWKARLVWNTRPTALTAFDATIIGTVGLSTANRKLLLQRGATDGSLPDVSASVEVERDAPGESEPRSLGERSIPE